MRLFLYKLLTQAIIILGKSRSALRLDILVLKDRTYRESANYPGYLHVCCDCGLAHRMWVRDSDIVEQPSRPRGYDYSLRMGSEIPSYFREMRPEDTG